MVKKVLFKMFENSNILKRRNTFGFRGYLKICTKNGRKMEMYARERIIPHIKSCYNKNFILKLSSSLYVVKFIYRPAVTYR